MQNIYTTQEDNGDKQLEHLQRQKWLQRNAELQQDAAVSLAFSSFSVLQVAHNPSGNEAPLHSPVGAFMMHVANKLTVDVCVCVMRSGYGNSAVDVLKRHSLLRDWEEGEMQDPDFRSMHPEWK